MASKSIAKRDNGKWRARYRDVAGKEHARHFDRKIDAQQWLDEVTAAIVTGQYVDPKAGRITFGAWFDQWVSEQVWEDGTIETTVLVRKSLTFADKPIRTVTQSDVKRWLKSLTLPTATRPKGLAPSTIKVRFNYVRMAFIAARVDKVIATDPTDQLDYRKAVKASARTGEVRRSDIPTPEQVAAALESSWGPFHAFIAVCAFGGLRLGEAAGLRARDVRFLERQIDVEQQVQGQTVATARITPPKYGTVRRVHVSADLVEILAAHVAKTGATDDDLLFLNDGEPFNRNSAGNKWRTVRKNAGIPERFTLHSLRHFFASGLIAAGCDVATVQKALGHSSPAITLDIYTHLWPDSEERARAAASAVSAAVLRPGADPVRTEGVVTLR
ncbi:tyrosine-type recombinase/integrase [Aeromicrobium sp. 179-A 4D2 NHS]|uniref:tyrosine-type recombinase/integrase n=1 Tax=Aeromicrobium sp. 179-A 4D2 NHS TaxID=3142375 RepID=UPI0039A333BC